MNGRTLIVVASLLLPLGAAAQIVPRGSEFQVNSYTTGAQEYPAMAAWADGSFVVAWESFEQDGYGDGVFGRRYDSTGQALGAEFQINTYTTYWQTSPAVAAGADGAFVLNAATSQAETGVAKGSR